MFFQVPQLGVDALFLSVVPADVGKPTVKLEKGRLEGGSYYWESAVFETVKFVQDSKSGKINDRIYHFIVSKVQIFAIFSTSYVLCYQTFILVAYFWVVAGIYKSWSCWRGFH